MEMGILSDKYGRRGAGKESGRGFVRESLLVPKGNDDSFPGLVGNSTVVQSKSKWMFYWFGLIWKVARSDDCEQSSRKKG
jgi:hypothetical protein